RLISIGEAAEPPASISGEYPLSYIGSIIYQAFTDGMMRIVQDLQSSQPLDNNDFISLLSRQISIYDSLKQPDELYQEVHPMVKAESIFSEMNKNPNAFTLFNRSEWIDAHKEFLNKHKQKGEINNDQS